jgi:hypothetical protein
MVIWLKNVKFCFAEEEVIMAAKGGEGAGLGGSGLQEHSGDGGNKVHWGLPVQDPCQGGPSGQSVVSTTTFALQSPAVQPTNTVNSEKL